MKSRGRMGFKQLSWISLFLVLACNSSDPDPIIESYFPLDIGFYQVYQVEEIRYLAFQPPQSFSYQIKSRVLDSFTNSSGGITYVIDRSIRADEFADWESNETWSVRTEKPYIIVNEGNQSYVRLVTSPAKNLSWDGNLYNSLGQDEYQITETGIVFTADGDLSFNDCVVVVQENESNLVNKDERIEVYSLGKGLVFKESKVWNYNCSGGTCTDQIVNGYYLKMTLIESGQE